MLTLTACANRFARFYREWTEARLIKKSNALPSGYRSEKEYSMTGEPGDLVPYEEMEDIRPLEDWEIRAEGDE